MQYFSFYYHNHHTAAYFPRILMLSQFLAPLITMITLHLGVFPPLQKNLDCQS